MSAPSTCIAVLDDEPDFRQALKRLLRSYGFQVELFAKGSELIAAALSRRFDCVLLDLHMPEVSGVDVMTEFKARHVQSPVIVITGHDVPGTAETTRALGAVSYLLKPLDETALLAAIGQATHPAR